MTCLAAEPSGGRVGEPLIGLPRADTRSNPVRPGRGPKASFAPIGIEVTHDNHFSARYR